MDTSGLSTVGTSTSSLTRSRTGIADNFDTFLGLLTTQLKNQNPLDPLDTNQFTEQLVQFTSVEQQLKTNEFLEALIQTTANSVNTQALGYIGKEITASTSLTELKDNKATWGFDADEASDHATFTVRDTDGNVIYTETKAIKAGDDKFVWDGTSSTGSQVPNGSYQLTIDARDENGQVISVATEMTGVVEGVDLSGGEPFLIVGKARISLSSVTSIGTAS